jgi:two-component sensor histidine kinase
MRKVLFLWVLLFVAIQDIPAQATEQSTDSIVDLAYLAENPEEGIIVLQSGLDNAGNCISCKALLNSKLGVFFASTAAYPQAELAFDEAIRLRRLLGDSMRVAGNYINKGNAQKNKGAYNEAIESVLYAIEILEPLNQKYNTIAVRDTLVVKNLGSAYANLSNYYNNYKDSAQGLKYALKAHELNAFWPESWSCYESAYTLSNQYFGMYDKTDLAHYADSFLLLSNWCLQYVSKLDIEQTTAINQMEIAHIYSNLGSLAINQERFNDAINAIDLSEEKYLKVEDSIVRCKGIMRIQILRANYCLSNKKDHKSALGHLLKVQSMSKTIPLDTLEYLEVYELFSKSYEGLGKMDSALFYSRKADVLNQKIFMDQQSQFIKAERESTDKTILLKEATIATKEASRRFWAIIAVSLALLTLVIALLWKQREEKQKKQIEDQNQEIEDTLNNAKTRFYQGLIEGQEIERNETKHILHNDIANTVLTLSYDIENAQPKIPLQEKWVKDLRQLAAHTRKLSHQKGGIIGETGLVESIRDLFKRVSVTKDINAEFIVDKEAKRFDINTEVEIWHIVQELVSNTLKYAQASHIELSIDSDEDSIYLMYADNGKGFKFDETINKQKSIGLQSIVDKTLSLGGNQPEIISSPGHGITVSIQIPASKSKSL